MLLDDGIEMWMFEPRQVTESLSATKDAVRMLLCQALFLAQSYDECVGLIHSNGVYSEQRSKLLDLSRLAKRARDHDAQATHHKLGLKSSTMSLGDSRGYHFIDEEEPRQSKWMAKEEGRQGRELRTAGAVRCEAFPWQCHSTLARSATLKDNIKEQLRALTKDRLFPHGKCTLNTSDIRRDIRFTNPNKTDVLGIFPAVQLPAHQTIFVDQTHLCAVSSPTQRCNTCYRFLEEHAGVYFSCCNIKACSNECLQRARASFHSAVCTRDFSRIFGSESYQSARRTADDQLLLRVLATAVKCSDSYPLHTPIIESMTAQYHRDTPYEFTLRHNLDRPLRMLEVMGIDIFAEQQWDCWVLQTIQARIRTNIREHMSEGQCFVAINPLYIFFNHSCEPNVEIQHDCEEGDATSTLRFSTARDVGCGTELCISYLSEDGLGLGLAERRDKLRDWTGADCRCSRCEREEMDEAQNLKFNNYDMPEGWTG